MKISTLLAASAVVATVGAQEQKSVDDRDPTINYIPPSAWLRWNESNGTFRPHNSTTTFTYNLQATATWRFYGTHVELRSFQTNSSRCGFALDGESELLSSTTNDDSAPQAHQRGNLDPSVEHEIKVTVISSASEFAYCEIDRFIYVPVSGDNSHASRRTRPPWGAIGGAIAGGLCLALLVVILYRRRHRCRNSKDLEQPMVDIDPLSSERPRIASAASLLASSHMYRYATSSGTRTRSLPDKVKADEDLVVHNLTSANGGTSNIISLSGRLVLHFGSATEQLEEEQVDEEHVASTTISTRSSPSARPKRIVLSAESDRLDRGVGGPTSRTHSPGSPVVQRRDGSITVVPSESQPEELPPAYSTQWRYGKQR